MTKFTIALREIETYKEVLRSQVVHFILKCDYMYYLGQILVFPHNEMLIEGRPESDCTLNHPFIVCY